MAKAKGTANEMSFLGHLEVLRWHLIRSVVAALIMMIAAFLFRDLVFNGIILSPRNPDFISNRMFNQFGQWIGDLLGKETPAMAINKTPLTLVNIEMAGQFMSHVKISLIAGLILASPYIIWELWKFIAPALHENEKKYAGVAVFSISSLFIIGILFGYFIITPLSIDFLSTYLVSKDVINTIKLNSYISTVTTVTFATGLVFELPVVAYFTSAIGIVTPEFLKKYRRHAYVILLIIAAIITPPDVFSQILVCIPLIILYEISIYISRFVVKRKKKRELLEESGIS
ncbi:MAG: twin-arginine translocase subunit TatC [Prolixibacteraceae bacterium]|nr:twin-arginine translocase subunit TatC [Prolixibacteraceae bacterium]